VGLKLAYTGAVKDNVVDIETLAVRLIELLGQRYPQVLESRYKITVPETFQGFELLELCGRKRGMLISGGEVDTERMSRVLLEEYRSGKLGRFTFEFPPEDGGMPSGEEG
jgi:ribosome biogenesis GTPase A